MRKQKAWVRILRLSPVMTIGFLGCNTRDLGLKINEVFTENFKGAVTDVVTVVVESVVGQVIDLEE